ncbi:MFS transporter [Heyndrickxia shackletonii]|uniref:MFS transporter n=1 Tax=Heyndrickxia shackletonii TaxID=157838 RepID=A0A0Q3TE60_9BACI|nr:MFS transporter [Heyndrickxia shackletonii]KQL52350.1 MFS transporter [Heyndrickxia shackletonii]NEZ01658.1 MFS transporter [Heyndrickxia shackletonii]
MSRLSLKGFHPIVWTLLGGTVFARGASFMAMPFLALYLSHTEGIHPVIIGIIVGIGPLSGTVGGFIGGHLSDRFGRKVIMLSSVFTWAFVFIGFSFAKDPLAFFLLNALNGICRSFFEPTSQALMADLTEPEKRLRVFALRYTAINIGAAVGPLLGAYFGVVSSTVTFLITGSFYLIYGVILASLLRKYKVKLSHQVKKVSTIKDAFNIIRLDSSLRFFIIGGILVNIGYSQIDSSLPQHLGRMIENGPVLFSLLLSINAITVVVLQIPLSHLVEKWRVLHVMMLGSFFFVLGFLFMGFAGFWISFIISMVLLTIGEIFLFPSTSVFIDQIAKEELRGTYFGAAQFRSIGNSVGPVMGGWILNQWNGHWLFWMMAFIVTVSIYFFLAGSRRQLESVVGLNNS